MTFQNAYHALLSLTNLYSPTEDDVSPVTSKTLKRTSDFLSQLGSPHEKIDFIHVAGTSGKGSVCSLLHQILTADGQNVGTYFSPHTTNFLERFALGNRLYDGTKLAKHIKTIMVEYEKYLEHGEPLSFFELSVCLAIYAFQKAGVDFCILETGMGGRYDATNVIPKPAVAVITNIDKDHTQFLGKSLTSIAAHKAGIIKHAGLVICGETRPSLKQVFIREAIKEQAALFFVPSPLKNLVAEKFGLEQQHNAALATRAAQEIGIKQKSINQALKNYRPLPCRFETIQKYPLIILDGAHAPAKVTSTARLIKKLEGKPRIIFGCVQNKDAEAMLKILAPLAKSVTTTRFKTTFRKAANPAKLLSFVPARKRAGYFLDFRQAFNYVLKLSKNNDPIVITGSLYLAGEMRAIWISENAIIANQSSFIK